MLRTARLGVASQRDTGLHQKSVALRESHGQAEAPTDILCVDIASGRHRSAVSKTPALLQTLTLYNTETALRERLSTSVAGVVRSTIRRELDCQVPLLT